MEYLFDLIPTVYSKIILKGFKKSTVKESLNWTWSWCWFWKALLTRGLYLPTDIYPIWHPRQWLTFWTYSDVVWYMNQQLTNHIFDMQIQSKPSVPDTKKTTIESVLRTPLRYVVTCVVMRTTTCCMMRNKAYPVEFMNHSTTRSCVHWYSVFFLNAIQSKHCVHSTWQI